MNQRLLRFVVTVPKNPTVALSVLMPNKCLGQNTPDNITAIRPLKDGVIADFEVTQNAQAFYQQSEGETLFSQSKRDCLCAL